MRDFLRPHQKEVKLRADVFPSKRPVRDDTLQLDLNKTARTEAGGAGVDKFSPYMAHMTYAVLEARLAFPLETTPQKAQDVVPR